MSGPYSKICSKCGRPHMVVSDDQSCPYCEGKIPTMVGKDYHFDACHFIPGHEKCGGYHGHTWTVSVMVSGNMKLLKDRKNPEDAMLIDFHNLDDIVEKVLDQLDHKVINDYLLSFPPTCENLAYYIAESLAHTKELLGFTITIRLQEGKGGYAIIQREA